ncbi:MAG: lipocalin-like domain-containing protein [Longimicrobiales bacterium]
MRQRRARVNDRVDRRGPTLLRLARLLVASTAMLGACGDGGEREIGARLTLAEALAATGEGYAQAVEPRQFTFPQDHGPHPGFATEWWYITGNLRATDGRRFGYQLTFFRKALIPRPADRISDLAADHAFMANLAVTDVSNDVLHAFDRFAREAAGLAGAHALPFRVWLYDWSVESTGEATFPARIRAAEDKIALELVIDAGKPPVVHGDRGVSRKSGEPGNASYYYSLTRMPTRGTIRIGDAVANVEGASWMDREWGTRPLGGNLDAWDWFALQLSDGTELMLYQLRTRDGGVSPFSAGTAIATDGTSRTLDADEFTIDVVDTWRSPLDGTRYPSRWRIRIPSERLELDVAPLVADQELDLAVRYWEGTVGVRGTRGPEAVRGKGYVELTGYAEARGIPSADGQVRGRR